MSKNRAHLNKLFHQNGSAPEADNSVLSAEGNPSWNSGRAGPFLEGILTEDVLDDVTKQAPVPSTTSKGSTNQVEKSVTSQNSNAGWFKVSGKTLALLTIAGVLSVKLMQSGSSPASAVGGRLGTDLEDPSSMKEKRIAFLRLVTSKVIDRVNMGYTEDFVVKDFCDDAWESYNVYDATLTKFKSIRIEGNPDATKDGRQAWMTLQMVEPEMWAKMKFLFSRWVSDVHCTGLGVNKYIEFRFRNLPFGALDRFSEMEAYEVNLYGEGNCIGFERLGRSAEEGRKFVTEMYKYYNKYFALYVVGSILNKTIQHSRGA